MRSELGCGIGLVALIVSGAAYAQTAPTTPVEAEASPDDIVVTASRRSEVLRDVPSSIAALSAQELNRRGVQSVLDLARAVPGLTVEEQSPGFNRIFLRGVANPNNLTSLVGVYLDEIPVTGASLAQLDVQLDDLERVEVLRGPQGTLYGQGSAGGTVRFITRRPDLENVSGNIDLRGYVTEKGDSSGRAAAVVNLPIVKDKLAVRVAGVIGEIGGWIDQPAAKRSDINNQKLRDVRAKALFKPIEDLSIEGTVNIHRNRGDGLTVGADRDYSLSFPNGDPLARERFVDDFNIYNVTSTFTRDNVTALSSTSFVETNKLSVGTAQKLPGAQETFNTDNLRNRSFTQEIRFSSANDQGFSWVLGGFYTNERLTRDLNIGFFVGGMNFGTFPLPAREQSKTLSGFGDASYALTDRLTVGAGLRYFTDVRELTNASGTNRADFDSFNPRFYARYRLTDTVNLYTNIAKGFRSGGFLGDAARSTYGPENVWSYEGGIKGSRGIARFELAGYYSTYKGYQAFALTSAVFGGIVNAGDGEIYGTDFLLGLRPVRGLDLQVSGNVNHGRLTRLVAGSTSNLIGDRIDFTPDYSVTASAQYDFTTGSTPTFVRVDYNQIGPASYTERSVGIIGYRTDTLNFLNARIGAKFDRISAELFGDNLVFERGIQDPLSAIGTGSRPRPRTFGVRLATEF